jgi:EAL domain-containing protein (putative c-di-GMP-specific phosphodiesterase class I)
LRTPSKLIEDVQSALAASGLPGSALELELTESMLIEAAEDARTALQELRQLGVSFALDDFGTGYSSLSYLRQLHVDCLKIDRSFVSDLSRNDDDERVMMAILGISTALRLRTVAEGVETRPQLELLRLHGCMEAQGFLFARPLAPVAVEELLAKGLTLDPGESSYAA